MKLSIHVKTGKRAARVTKTGDNQYAIEVSARPEKGKANDAVLKALAKHLGIAPSRLTIISGHTSTKKVLDVG